MSVYRLDPIDMDDLCWQVSTEKKPLWASAATPATARELAAIKTTELHAPTRLFAPIPLSPWLDERLATCTVDTSKGDIPVGTVIRADGSVV
jgi:hypothetical protein